jgi:hypothetical protein
VPVADPETHPGLVLAFRVAAVGRTDRDIATMLNAAGYRTSGNRGANPFTKDMVRRILMNRFYLGELPDGEGGWLPGKHHPVLDVALFDAAQDTRSANCHDARKVRSQAQVYSLSGIGDCAYCHGPLHIFKNPNGRPRVHCYHGRQGEPCGQRATFLDIYEAQIADYLTSFHIPTDYQRQITALYSQASSERDDAETRRRQITARLDRIKELYAWGDLARDDYQHERDALTAELATLERSGSQAAVLARAAAFLNDLPAGWEAATQEQRNQLARLLFERVEIRNKTVVAVTPRPEFARSSSWIVNSGPKSWMKRKRRGSIRRVPTQP